MQTHVYYDPGMHSEFRVYGGIPPHGGARERDYASLSTAEIDAEVDQKIRDYMKAHAVDYQAGYRAVLADPANAALKAEYAAFRIRRRA